MTVSICIGVYNNIRYTSNLIEQIIETEKNSKHEIVELIVHDNGSTDGTAQYLLHQKYKYPKLKIIFTPNAIGYSRAYNKMIFESKGDILLLLNNDLIISDDWIDKFVDPFNDPKIGIVSPSSTSPNRTMVCGFCISLRKSTFEQIGQLNQGYRNYGVDNDLITRLYHNQMIYFVYMHDLDHTNDNSDTWDFCVKHHKSKTIETIPQITELTKQEGIKYNYYINNVGNLDRYAIIPKTYDYLVNTINNIRNMGKESMICCVIGKEQLLSEIYDMNDPVEFYKKDIHVMPQLLADNYVPVAWNFYNHMSIQIFTE